MQRYLLICILVGSVFLSNNITRPQLSEVDKNTEKKSLSINYEDIEIDLGKALKACTIDNVENSDLAVGQAVAVNKQEIKDVEKKSDNAKDNTNQNVQSNSKNNTHPSRGGEPVKPNKITMTEDERYWLGKLIEAEAADEPYNGKVAVATVIANRVIDKTFPNTVNDVIRQKGQYSPWTDGSIYKRNASEDTKKAIREVFDGGKRTIPSETMYFIATYVNGNWVDNTRKYITTIGNHKFYSKHAK